MGGKQRESYSGEATQKHDEREAENLIRKGMKALGVSEEDVLGAKKSALIKGALAWYVHTNALASHKWISDRLQTGCPSNLTAYIGRFKNASGGEALRLRRILEHA